MHVVNLDSESVERVPLAGWTRLWHTQDSV